MLGYIKNEKATSETIRDGWLRTGDILRLDENNNFWVTDRLKEVREVPRLFTFITAD